MPDLTLGAAIVAGLISFISPCVLPVVPAYLGQLGALAVTAPALAPASGPALGAGPSPTARRLALLPHALAFVFGFGLVFTLLGLTVYAGRALGFDLPFVRQIGGLVLIVLGLNLAGILRLRTLARSWRPLDRFVMERRGPFAARTPLGAFGLGVVFAVGWTPCVGPTLGAILGLSALGPSAQVVALFAAYALGLAIPFLALALTLDRAPALIRPLVRHGRAVEMVGGLLVVLVGVAVLFDWLTLFAQAFSFLWPRV
jgi:cytochrome c-type biogenesis protein